jgi:PAS domain S-box-containing protein
VNFKFGLFTIGFFSVVLYLSPIKLYGQIGYPVINNFSPNELGSIPQIWEIVQDNKGVFYFASNIGVVKFNGSNWQHYPLPLNANVRSIAIDHKGTVYVGASHEFGFLKPNSKGQFEYVSLSDSIHEKNIGEVLSTFVLGNTIYFIANHNRIFSYCNSVLKEIPSHPFNFFRAFKIHDEIYLFDKELGVGKIIDGIVEVIDTKSNMGSVYFAVPYAEDELLVGTLKSGIFIYNLTNFVWKKFQNDINEELIEGNVYHAIILKNSNIAIATLKKGVFVINQAGKLVQSINRQSGLINNTTFYVYECKCNDLWVGHEKGLSQIELSIPIIKFGVNSGIEGSPHKIEVYNNYIFCGTSSGIFAKPLLQDASLQITGFVNLNPSHIYNLDFEKVEVSGTPNPIFLASCLRNLVWITPDIKLKEIYDIYGCYSIAKSQNIPGRVFLGSPSGIDVLDLEFINNELVIKDTAILPNIKESIRNLHVSANDDLWVQTAFNTILKIEFNQNYSLDTFHIHHFNDLNDTYPNIIVTGLFGFNNKIILTSNCGVLSTQIRSDSMIESPFAPDNMFGTNFQTDSLQIQTIGKDEYGNFWIATQNGVFMFNPFSGELLQPPYLKTIDMKIQNIVSILNYGVCMVSRDEVFFVDQLQNVPPHFNFDMVIQKVEIGNNYKTINFDGQKSLVFVLKENIPSNQNTIAFNYGAPFYQRNESIQYTSKLQGFDKNWSPLSDTKFRMYTNLPGGKYTFQVKAINIYGIYSSESNFSFTIATPWYKTTFSIIAYFFLGIILFWLSVQYFIAKIKREKLEIQATLLKSQLSAHEQNSNFNQQSDKLNELSREFEKVSLAANFTNDAIVIFDSQGDIEWVNEGYQRLFGYTIQDLLLSGTKLLEENAHLTLNKLTEVWLENQKPLVFENLKKTKMETQIITESTITPIIDDANTIKYFVLVERELSKENRKL